MKKKIQIFLIMMLVVLLSVSIIPLPLSNLTVIGQEINDTLPIGVETYLIKNHSEYKNYGLDTLKNLPKYNSESLTNFHMPIVYKIPLSAKMDVKKFLHKGTFLHSNKNFDDRILNYGYDVYGNLKSDEYFVVDYWLEIKASDKPFSVDFIPKIELNNIKYDLLQYDWWNSSWYKMKTITINHTYIDSGLSNYPILIYINDTSVLNACQNSGQDIRFVNLANTTVYNHEIEFWNSTNAYVWVNVTNISSSSDTIFNMYYDNNDANDGQNINDTWDSNFTMIQHMDDKTTSSIEDSTSNNNDGTKKGVNEPIEINSGKIGYAQDFDGSDDKIDCGNIDLPIEGTKYFTLSSWINIGTSNQPLAIVGTHDVTTYNLGWSVQVSTDFRLLFIGEGALGNPWDIIYNGIPNATVQDKWILVTLTRTDDTFQFYQNDSAFGIPKTDVSSVGNGIFNLFLGCTGNVRYMDGGIDEFRISDIIRNTSWIKANFHSQNQTTGFLTFGSELTGIKCPDIVYTNESPTNGDNTVSYLIDNLSITINISDGSNFNYSIECSNGNTTSANGVSNGTYNLSVYCLETETLYYWYVNTTYNTTCGWENVTYNFTTAVSGCQCTDELTLIYNKLDDIEDILEGDKIIEIETTQFVLLMQLFLLCIFLWIGCTIPAMEGGNKKEIHYMPFSGGLFIMFGGLDFISFAVLMTNKYSLGIVGGFLTVAGIVLLIYGVLKAFYYE